MATVKFHLSTKVDKETGKAPLLIRFVGGRGLVFRAKSGITISPERWKNKVVIPRLFTHEKRELLFIQKKIDDLSNFILSQFSEADKAIVNKEWLVQLIDQFRFPEKYDLKPEKEASKPLLSAFSVFLCNKEISEARMRHYKVVQRMLMRFEKYKRLENPDFILDLDCLNPNVIKDFENYLKLEHTYFYSFPEIFKDVADSKKPLPKGQNTIHGILQKLRCFILWANNKHLTNNDPFKAFETKHPLYGTPFYITIKERNQIQNADLSARPQLAIQRDIFIFQCLIGCRVGDLIKLKKTNLINGAIEYIPRKTKDGNPVTVRVPLNEPAKVILDKYVDYDSDKLLPFISQVNYNLAIREIFTIAEITRMVVVINTITRQEEQKPLNKIASSHIARRTFIGNLYKQVKDPNLVGSLSGHKEGSKAFARYRDIDEDTKNDLVKLLE